MALRTLLSSIVFIGLGALGYRQVFDTLIHDFLESIVLLITLLLGVVSVLMWSDINGSNPRKKWAWRAGPFALCLLMYSAVLAVLGKLGQYPTLVLSRQFGLRNVALFCLIFVWIAAAPAGNSSDGNSRSKKLQLAVTAVAAVALAIFGAQFLHASWSARSISQLRDSARTLIYAGFTVYLFSITRILLPKIISGAGDRRVEHP